jgi:hypothetical protein
MKSKLTQRRFKANKAKGGCAMCHPHKHGWEGKRTVNDQRKANTAEQQLKEL